MRRTTQGINLARTTSPKASKSKAYGLVRIILVTLDKEIGEQQAEILIGSIEGIVSTALLCCCIYRAAHPNTKLIYLPISKPTPPWYKKFFDAVLHSSFEGETTEYAFNYRNHYIVDRCDVCITNISDNNGALFDLYLRAKNNGKTVYNLYEHQI